MSNPETAPGPRAQLRRWIPLAISMLILIIGGVFIRLYYFSSATASTSYQYAEDIWYGDPRTSCEPRSNGGYMCTPNSGVSSYATMRFTGVRCGSPDDLPQVVPLKLTVGELNKVDQRLSEEQDTIRVTYRPKLLGVFGSNRVKKVQAVSSKSGCEKP